MLGGCKLLIWVELHRISSTVIITVLAKLVLNFTTRLDCRNFQGLILHGSVGEEWKRFISSLKVPRRSGPGTIGIRNIWVNYWNCNKLGRRREKTLPFRSGFPLCSYSEDRDSEGKLYYRPTDGTYALWNTQEGTCTKQPSDIQLRANYVCGHSNYTFTSEECVDREDKKSNWSVSFTMSSRRTGLDHGQAGGGWMKMWLAWNQNFHHYLPKVSNIWLRKKLHWTYHSNFSNASSVWTWTQDERGINVMLMMSSDCDSDCDHSPLKKSKST